MRKITIFITLLLASTIASAQTISIAAVEKRKPFVLGVIDEIRSGGLGETRVLNIYLPDGYNEKDSIKYPVTYLLDGSADEDFIHIVGLYQFNNFPWIDRVPKSIVVGIGTVDRRRDFTFPTTVEREKKSYPTTGHSAAFINFIEKELQPYIERKYKGTGARTIIGQSLGGLLATEILMKKPKLFDKYIILSPSLWWDNGSLLNTPLSAATVDSSQKTEVYIGVGKEGLAPGNPPRVMEVDANLLAEKIKGMHAKNMTVYLDYLPQEDHATIMHQAVFNALRIMNPAKEHK
jgi:predicted alpha/beta superfamily hydrolase